MKQIDGRKLWLDENALNAATIVGALNLAEKRRELTKREQDMKMLSAAFMYLYSVVEERELLKEVENLFEPETVH
jgi:hypothetical protein|tara:strand:+ start:177 stop:401 length:225 start_codon:yes stop_codon:yes gene_type:complete